MKRITLGQKAFRSDKGAEEFSLLGIKPAGKIFEEKNITFQHKFLQVPANVCNGKILVKFPV